MKENRYCILAQLIKKLYIYFSEWSFLLTFHNLQYKIAVIETADYKKLCDEIRAMSIGFLE